MTRVFENIWISFENISNSETLSNSMIFTREDNMTSSKYMKYELEVLKELNSKSFWNYFQFGVIWILFKLFFSKNKIYGKQGNTIPYIRKLERNKFELILVFLKWFLLDFIRRVALFELSEFVWILFNARKMFSLWKIFFWKFWYVICLYKVFILFLLFVFPSISI